MLDELLGGHSFLRHGSLVAVPAGSPRPASKADPPTWTPDRLVVSWVRWREYPDSYHRAEAGEEHFTADDVTVWGDGRVGFDVLGHRCSFQQWPAPWLRAAISAVLQHVGDGTGAQAGPGLP